ncbi:DUF2778 domain-containing protein [Methylobacterium soli]|uniref:DUF2778 domain-containing protein n=1 Tax=Methylobacterium soli TaxID=553447 RepID=A0A6L3TAM1_9HYPH|nr:DUF2778 domain-containing protein [Methylobacterium soli]KAB1080947.1 DUF2778 domain-containing protein [Methylobacterium soli]GJE43894.1 hypothetical protein AEGHOMDF_3073 [Methylobacterium soli]
MAYTSTQGVRLGTNSFRRLGLASVPLTIALAAAFGLSAIGTRPPENDSPLVRPDAALPVQEIALPSEGEDAAPGSDLALGAEADQLWREALREASPAWSSAETEPPTPFAQQDAAEIAPAPAQEPPRLAQTVPLPVPRPQEFRQLNPAELTRRADRSALRRARTTALPIATEDDRSFFEKLFGVERPAGPALAYAALESNPADVTPRRRLSPTPIPEGGTGTAVYDISARIVHMPSGERLEAHSGLGATMDDPNSVHLRMKGATPPGTYDLSEREALFHGVRAIRLNPVGGSAAVHGRVGLLAHTYMLGPSGASNGCVSFKDYDKFLQAYLRGEIQRLVVVSGRGQDLPPSMAGKPRDVPGRSARLGGEG